MDLEVVELQPTSFRLLVKGNSQAGYLVTIVGPGTKGWPQRSLLPLRPPANPTERFTVFDGLRPGATYRVVVACSGEHAEISATTPKAP